MALSRSQRGYLQQAIWRVQAAKELMGLALDGHKLIKYYDDQLSELIEEMEADLAENSEMVD